MDNEKKQQVEEQRTALDIPKTMDKPTIWNDANMMQLASRQANMLAQSGLVPDSYRSSPANCLIAIDMANRLCIPPLMVMQNLYVVKGKPAWSGAFCAALINGSGKFSPLEYVFVGEEGKPTYGCYATAVRYSNGKHCKSDTVTMQMAADEGWINKPGSKWKTMPTQMMMYRAASFFARAHCAELILGLPTVEEAQDITEDPANFPPRAVVSPEPEPEAKASEPERVSLSDL